MAYETTNPPHLLLEAPGGLRRVWLYTDGDAMATVDASGYFTDGYARGMRDGDLCLVYDEGNKIWSAHTVTVSTTTVDLANGTTIGSATNSD